MLAQVVEEAAHVGWYVGYAIGILVVLVVVVVVSWIIRSAVRIGDQARQASSAIERAQATTAPLWRTTGTNRALSRLHAKLREARAALE